MIQHMYIIIFNSLMSYYKVDTLVTSTKFKKLNFAEHPLPMYMSYINLLCSPQSNYWVPELSLPCSFL